MARYYSEADYCAEEEMSRPVRGHCHHGGGESYVVRKEAYEEIDEVELARRGHGHGHLGHGDSLHHHGARGGHLGHSGSHRGGHLGHSGSHLGHREHHVHGHGHGGSHHCVDPCESRYDSSCTGQYYG
ncbi:hypothetical protein BRADI_2g58340v3 [Brachypodium distachyon]|uniref:Uncharacterized protein n=1 Tax=Brachypodium distachyon TaxID=15368 RepID=I1HUG1_BRADI|nr:hypothetical protein BRADI_2g58340v3 [Brachypodium distachyon]